MRALRLLHSLWTRPIESQVTLHCLLLSSLSPLAARLMSYYHWSSADSFMLNRDSYGLSVLCTISHGLVAAVLHAARAKRQKARVMQTGRAHTQKCRPWPADAGHASKWAPTDRNTMHAPFRPGGERGKVSGRMVCRHGGASCALFFVLRMCNITHGYVCNGHVFVCCTYTMILFRSRGTRKRCGAGW